MPSEFLKILVSIDWKHPSFTKSLNSAIVFPLHTQVKNRLSIQNAVKFS
jgi:hypothetical protein